MVRRYTAAKKRSNKRRRRNPVNAISVSKALYAAKDYIFEDRSATISSAQNYVRYGVLPVVFNTYQTGSVGASNPGYALAAGVTLDSIVTAAGHEASANSATDPNYKVRVFKQHCSYRLRNVSNHPAFLTLYDFVCKIDNPDTNSPGALAIEDLVLGWKNKLVSTAVDINGSTADPVFVTWDETSGAFNAPNEWVDTLSSQLHPSLSYNFQQNYKMVRKHQYKLLPGDDVFWQVSGPSMDVEPTKRADYTSSPAIFRNKTKFTLYRVHGAMGKQATDDSIVGYMTTDISCETLFRAKTYRIQAVERSIQMVKPKLDAVASALEGPSEHTMGNENQ